MTEISLKQAHILIVDDEVGNTCLMTNVLNRLGFTNVKSLTDPTLVFRSIESFQPDLLLLDLNMPRINGFQVMEQLRKQIPAEDAFPILVLSGDATMINKRKALASGATDILSKPFDPSEIMVRIRNLLSARFLHIEIQEQNQMLEQRVAERTVALEEALADLKSAQRQMLQQERLHAFAQMAGGVVHDFSNALMSVIGYSDILIQNPAMLDDKETVTEFLRTMNTAGRDASQVISRLRDFYRPRDEGDLFEPTDLNEIVEQVIPLTQPRWKDLALEQGRTIELAIDLKKVPPINGNPAEMREVLTNLILNSVDAMPNGGKITLRTQRRARHIVIEVADTGCGMSAEVRARCLDPFFSTKGDKGTGLGLSMVHGIVKRHDGTLEIDTQPGHGTTFRMIFPSLVPTIEVEANRHVKCDRALRVLVVDNEEVSRNVLAKYLTAVGHEVALAESGEQALEILQTHEFDLLVTDQGMPGMSGVQLAEHVHEKLPDQPVILVSGFTNPDVVTSAKLAGVDCLLNKPLGASELLRAIATVMKQPLAV